ncbi:MAG: S-layer homology domain-containing protein [Anaeromicrobium sp.]|jgi:hypothetical protein|uniref:S-layer homology domain-containing protein n=1 Tax=Anaeromicrobium sp. TaxID=1929132 RepID=UPI0025DEEC09|nr:S-layer homology domain-containing protein [Anaeromicrobium sp.]MCT4593743.1 S-layer homology domain-containing protein [Anaeromicrobium sp.]
MRKIISIILGLVIILMPISSWATPPIFSGGVNNEYKYEEIVFISGKPIKFVGEIKEKEKIKDNEKTITYTLRLTPEDKNIDAKLDRTITLLTTYDKNKEKGQTIGKTIVDKYRESINVDKDKYDLEDYQLSKSDVTDNRPASDFYSGNLTGRKYYTINRDEGEVIVTISGSNTGYNNFWGSTETVLINKDIESIKYTKDKDGDLDKESWNGNIEIQVSDSTTKTLRYNDNKAELSSIDGGHMRVTESGMVSRIKYNMPYEDDDEINNRKRVRRVIQLSNKKVPKIERLIVPKFRDIEGHWAVNHIKKLYSLDVFNETSEFFVPDVPIKREEFTKAIIRACDIRPNNEEEENKRSRSRNKEPEVSPFKDVPVESPNYKYIKNALEKNIISGISKDLFAPEKSLTRAEAITILIRALGFQMKAPTPGFYTSFNDDSEIPGWSKDSIYVAKEIGIINGDLKGNIYPNKILTRAEASAMLVSLLGFLERDLQRDYRENIINYN